MSKTLYNLFDRGIEFLFYSLFLLVPIVFTGMTSELFEFNKMWLTFGITAIIAFFWFGKMILRKEFRIQRTPLDIFIFLFLLSQIISTIISIDPHVSFWGYYSRFNGGLLSTVCYIFLYYAFATNLTKDEVVEKSGVKKLFGHKVSENVLIVSIASGIFVSLWGLPSHFGYDPSCKLFRGTL